MGDNMGNTTAKIVLGSYDFNGAIRWMYYSGEYEALCNFVSKYLPEDYELISTSWDARRRIAFSGPDAVNAERWLDKTLEIFFRTAEYKAYNRNLIYR